MLFSQRVVRRFTRQLVLMLEGQTALPAALELMAMQERNRRWQDVLLDLRRRIGCGETLPQALAHHRSFRRSYVATILWAEKTGSADTLLVALRLLSHGVPVFLPGCGGAGTFPRRETRTDCGS